MQYKDVQFSLLMGIVRGEWRIVIRWPNGTALDRSFRGGKTDAVRGAEGIIDRWLTEHGRLPDVADRLRLLGKFP